MYRCTNCGKTFSEPNLKEKNVFKIFALTIKAQWDKTIQKESIYEKRCPFCNAKEEQLKAYIEQSQFEF